MEVSNASYEELLQGSQYMISRNDRRSLMQSLGIPKGKYRTFEMWITKFGQANYNAGINDCEKALTKAYSLPEDGQEEVRVDFTDVMTVIKAVKGIGEQRASDIQSALEKSFCGQ